MAEEYRCICKDCNVEFGYSEASILAGATRGLTRPERCSVCRRTHSRESHSIGIPQIPIKPVGRRKPDEDLTPGRLGKINHPKREHIKVQVESKFGTPDSLIDFGITDDDITELITTLQDYQIAVVVGPTGSGKSTFLPYRLMVPPKDRDIPQDIFTRFGQIAITQPRIQATRSIAKFVSQDLHGSSLGAGFDVGFRHGGSPASDWRNKLVYLTDGTLINWIVSGELANLSVIMIDEAHERSLNIDLILGLLKQQLPRYPHLKLIIASATINAELFQGHFGGPDKVALLEFKGLKQYKVEAYFPPGDAELRSFRYIPPNMAEKIYSVLKAIKNGEKAEGDILGFLPGEGEINKCIDILNSAIAEDSELRDLGINVYPLYTRLPQEEQDLALAKKTHVIRSKLLKKIQQYIPGQDKFIVLMLDQKSASEAYSELVELLENIQITDWTLTLLKDEEQKFNTMPKHIVFTTHPLYANLSSINDYKVVTDRRVVITTNVAETSLTVDGIVYVVDCGLIKQSSWNPENSASNLSTIFHSRAGCQQRWGRAGRVRDGEAYMLYTDTQYENTEIFPAHTVPEIQRSSLEQVVLKAKAAGIDDIETFPWIENPPKLELQRAPEVLRSMGALDDDGDLTGFGMELQSFMTDVPIASLLIAADQYACGLEMATLAALSSMRLQGGLLHWDRRWDFPSRNTIGKIHKQLAQPCIDDMDLFLKIYSIWAEAGNQQLQSTLCDLFFISATTIEERVVQTRRDFLEMLSIGKKGEEDRNISFSTLDRLRLVLALSLPEHFIFTCKDGEIHDLAGDSVKLPIEIDANSVLAEKLPPFFISLQRRISNRKDKESLSLSCLVQIDESWLELRKLSVLQQVDHVSRLLRPFRDENAAAKKRNKLFLDVNYPLGAQFAVTNTKHHIFLGELISLPLPNQPVFTEDKLNEASFTLPEKNKDIAALAGWEDKEDQQVAYEEVEEDNPESISLMGYDEIEFSITTFDKQAAKHLLPQFEFTNNLSGETVSEYIVADYDFTNSKVIFKPHLPDSAPQTNPCFSPGTELNVKGIEVLGEENSEKALLVQIADSPELQSIIDAKDLSFSGRWFIAEMYLNKTFTVKVIKRQNNVRLSRLPCIEEHIHTYLMKKTGKQIPCKLLEKDTIHLNFLLTDLTEQGIYESAYLKLPVNWEQWGITFKINNEYTNFFFAGETGHYSEKIPFPSDELLDFISKHKKKKNIFWDTKHSSLHTKSPMTSKLREDMECLNNTTDFRNSLARLYIFSNRLKLWVYKPGSILQKGQNALEEGCLLKELVPDYKKGDIVHGRISIIFEKSVLLVLEKGGTGMIDLDHLSWQGKAIADPREIISEDQKIECTVIRQREEIDLQGRKTVYIDLSMLNPKEFPAKYSVNSFHEVKIFRIDKEKKFALAELEPGITGYISTSILENGQTAKAKIKACNLNPLSLYPNMPVKIFLVLDIPEKTISIYKEAVPMIIGRQGSIIKKIQAETKCEIILNPKEETARILGKTNDNIEKAIAEIKKILQQYEQNTKQLKPTQPKNKIQHNKPLQKQQSFQAKIIIPTIKISHLIGPKGATINRIKMETNCNIQFQQDGSVYIMTKESQDNIEKCVHDINNIIPEARRV